LRKRSRRPRRGKGTDSMQSFIEQVAAAIPYLKKFENMYGVRHVDTFVVKEQGASEPAYIFSDRQGGLTIEGILRSLTPDFPDIETVSALAPHELIQRRTDEIEDMYYDIRDKLDEKRI